MSGVIKEKSQNSGNSVATDSPSMEEILMSIRNVIAGIKDPQTNANSIENSTQQQDEVLELTEIVDESGNIIGETYCKEEDNFFKNNQFSSMDRLKEQEQSIINDIDNALNNIETQFKVEPTKQKLNNPSSENKQETSLLSNEVADKTAKSLQNLVAQINNSKSQSNNNISNNTSLESLVINLLTPHLAEWMNNNLPTLVEKVIEREIKKIVEKHSATETK